MVIVTVSIRAKQIQAAIIHRAGITAKDASRRARIEAALAGVKHYSGVPCKCGNEIRLLSDKSCVICKAESHLSLMRRLRDRQKAAKQTLV